jgi:hypothetical protein
MLPTWQVAQRRMLAEQHSDHLRHTGHLLDERRPLLTARAHALPTRLV